MFGDFCHGLLLLAFAGWMVKVEKEHMDKTSKNEIWNIFFGGNNETILGLRSVNVGT